MIHLQPRMDFCSFFSHCQHRFPGSDDARHLTSSQPTEPQNRSFQPRISLVPFPQDLLQANYSPSQLSPFDHLNMAMTVTLMQLTWPGACALLLRYHTAGGLNRRDVGGIFERCLPPKSGFEPKIERSPGMPARFDGAFSCDPRQNRIVFLGKDV